MFCSDPAVNYLKGIGYNVIRLPRADFEPLLVLSQQGGDDLSVDGPLGGIMSAPGGLPPVTQGVVAADINGNKSSDLKIDLGLSILSGILSALGAGKIGLNAEYSNAATIQFQFSDVTIDGINRTDLDKFLDIASLSSGPGIQRLLDADKAYIVTSIIKSPTISVIAKDKNGASVGVDVPIIQNAVGGKVDVQTSAGADQTVTYKGKTPVAFGFQAVQLIYANGKYQSYRDLSDPNIGAKAFMLGQNELLAQDDAQSAGLLVVDSTFARFR